MPAGLCERLQPRRDIDAVAEDVVAIDDDVAEIDPDPEPDPAVLGHTGLAIDHRALQLGGAADRVDDAREFHQHPVAGRLDDAAGVLADLRIDQLAAMRLEAFVRAFLVRSHQPRIARHIGGEDRGETAALAHVFSPAANRRPDRYSSRCSAFRRTLASFSTTEVMARSRLTTSRASSSWPMWA